MLDLQKHMPSYKKAVMTNTNVEALIRERYGITRYSMIGDELTCSCPLPTGNHKHGDRSPSFSINVCSRLYCCYVCGGGNVAQFVMVMEGVGYDEAIEVLRGYQDEITEENFYELVHNFGETPVVKKTQEQIFNSEVEAWAIHYHPYWATRGFTPETIARFHLGYDKEDNRVVIPHYFGGQCIGYQKRTLDGNGPKWKNSLNFNRTSSLFNFDSASVWSKSVIVVEAAASVIWLSQLGYPNAVATFGSKVTREQAKLLRGFEKVTIWFDPDTAGEHGSEVLAKEINQFTQCYIVTAGGDPNELTAEQCREALSNAKPYI